MSDRLLYLVAAACALVVAALVLKTAADYQHYRTLIEEGRTATATVRDVRLAVHNRLGPRARWQVDYRFAAEGREIDADAGVTRAVAAQYHPGQRIDVVYAPGDPSLAVLNVEQAWAVVVYDEWVLVPYLALLIVLVWNVWERWRTR